MAAYDVALLQVSLHITDTPVGYAPPRGPAVDFRVDYNEHEGTLPQLFTFSNIGNRWTFAWQSYVEDNPLDPSAAASVHLAGGGQEVHSGYDSGTHSYVPDFFSHATLVRTSTSPIRYERRLPDGSVDVFEQADTGTAPRRVFLTSRADPQGNTISLTYHYDEGVGTRLWSVTDALGQVTSLSYENPDDPLKITKVTDPFARFAVLEYDSSGLLAKITDVIGIVSSFKYETTGVYQTGGVASVSFADFIKALTTPYGTTTFSVGQNAHADEWLEAEDPLGGKERFEAWYGNLPISSSETIVPTGVVVNNSSLQTWDTVYFDKRAQALAPGDRTKAQIIHWLGTSSIDKAMPVISSIKNPLENRVWYSYASQAQPYWLGSQREPSAISRVLDDGTTQTYRYEYNALGKVTRATDPVGRAKTFTYDTNGIDLLEVRQVNGQNTELLQTRTYNSQHRPLTVTDASGQTWTYTFNSQGQVLTAITPPRDGLTAAQRTTTFAYDTNGYLQSITGPATGATRTFTYDGYGRIRTVTDSDSHTLTFDYDALDRVTKRTYPDGTYEEIVYNRLDPEKRRDRLGRWDHFFHDALRRVVAMRDPLGQTVTQQWCSCGSLDKLIDANNNATTWGRDLQGRVTSEVRADSSSTTFVYENTTSRLKQRTDPKNQTTGYEYFADNSLKQITYTNPQSPTRNVSFTYDPIYRRLATRQEGSDVTTYSYHPVAITPTLGATQLAALDGPLSNDTLSYTYDELGRVKTRTLSGVTTTWNYDLLGRVTSEQNPLGTFTYGYDGVTARALSLAYPNGQTTTYDYLDNLGDRRLKEVHNKRSGGATLSKFNYTTDAAERLTTWTQQADSDPAKVYEYGYNPADELTAAVLKNTAVPPAILKSFGYDYDKAGNRTVEAIDLSVSSTAYSSVDRLQSQQAGGALRFTGTVSEPSTVTVQSKPAQVTGDNRFEGSATVSSGTNTVAVVATDPSNNVRTNTYQVTASGGAKTFTHDANGNLTGDGTRTFEYDAEDRLVAVNQGTLRSEVTNDGEGFRTRIVEKDGSTVLSDRRYVWCDTQLCEERDATGSTVLKRFFTHGLQEGSDAYFYSRDHLASIREMTDAAGTVRARYDYDPYGRMTKLSGDKDSPFGFTGHFAHSVSGLALAPYRAYDSGLGRWISEDPIGLEGGINLYGYALANPVTYVDPLGLQETQVPDPQPPGPPPTVPRTPPAPRVPPPQPPVPRPPTSGGAGGIGNAAAIILLVPLLVLVTFCTAANEGEEEDICDDQFEADNARCRTLKNKDDRRLCFENAQARYAQCLAGKPLQPLRPFEW
jgi:RHS repeat-associated protein